MEKIQEIINKGIEEYKTKQPIIGYKQKVIEAIRRCKTGELGAHKYQCDECGYEEIAYNSCRNRHCPNCQTGKKLKWIEARKEEVLNTKYYHVVFTIPSDLIQKLYNQNWIVYCKEPFKNAECVIQYLGRYTHRVAISNERILKIEEGKVTFKWRDYKDNNKMKEMTITTQEFIRRFLLHILPPKFMKIRYYGILGNRNKNKKLLKCKILSRTKIYKKREVSTLELLKEKFGKDFNLCPCCKRGHMLIPNTT